MINTVMSRFLVKLFLERSAAGIRATAFLALAEIFFAFVATGVAAVVLGAHVWEKWESDSRLEERYGRLWFALCERSFEGDG